MEDSFRVRVERAFGSLEASSSSSSSSRNSTPSSLSSLWCLTDEEIQRNEWIREKVIRYKHKDEEDLRLKNPKPFSSFLDSLLEDPLAAESSSHQVLESDIQDLDEDDNQQRRLSKPENGNNEDWDIRSSMGMDCTLDHEEEEDGYDKVAVGSGEAADQERFYMRDVNDYEVEIDSNNELPSSFTDVMRDPRANHMAAKLRLKQDDEELAAGSQVVPDYVLNPSKYTHYTFDSVDDIDDEESNRKAYMEFFKRSNAMAMEMEEEDPPRSIIFTPKKKSGDGLVKKTKFDAKKVSIAAEEVSVMDKDEPEITNANKSSSLQKKGSRRYRTKPNLDEESTR